MTTPWEDRRGMFQAGKQVHEPGKPMAEFGTRRISGAGVTDAVRRASTSSSDGLEKTLSGSSAGSPTSQRRRSSAANGGLFGSLNQHKRGSEGYADRRASHSEMNPTGLVSGWFNSTFRGMQGKPDAAQSGQQDPKRGVME